MSKNIKNIKLHTEYNESYSNLEEYINVYLQMLCAFVSEEYKLTFKEREFLTHCIVYQYNGGVLSDFYEFQAYIMSKKFCSKPNHVSMYKHKLSVKKWIKTSKYKFVLASRLNLEKGTDISSMFSLAFKPEGNAE